MKRFVVFGCSIVMAFIFSGCSSQPAENKIAFKKDEAAKEAGFAVVELFTSQGCSSCPSADKLLGKLIAQYKAAGKQLITLSFHVDYWNRLGWKDPFSQHIFSERQSAYAAQMDLQSVYTPQAVVDGKWETVGSNEAQVKQYIDKALAQKNTASLEINEVQQNNKTLTVSYAYKGSKAATLLHFAIVQNKGTTSIKAGENEGVTLNNYNIVHTWKTIAAENADAQQVALDTPEGYNNTEFSVIVFAQEKANGAIIAVSTK